MHLPLLSTPDKPIISTTHDLVPIADIVESIVIFKNGGAALVLESTSLNFGLLSEKEQSAVIASYAGLLNSFNFPVQLVVMTQKKDIASYMNYLAEAEAKIKSPKLKEIMADYKNFIIDAIKKKNVLSKKFYIIVPFTPYELGLAKSMAASFKPQKGPLPYAKSHIVRKAKTSLFPKRDHLVRQAGRLGIRLKQLKQPELVELFYNVYNPEAPIKEKELFS